MFSQGQAGSTPAPQAGCPVHQNFSAYSSWIIIGHRDPKPTQLTLDCGKWSIVQPSEQRGKCQINNHLRTGYQGWRITCDVFTYFLVQWSLVKKKLQLNALIWKIVSHSGMRDGLRVLGGRPEYKGCLYYLPLWPENTKEGCCSELVVNWWQPIVIEDAVSWCVYKVSQAKEWPQTYSTADMLLSWVGFCGYWWRCGTIKAVPVEGGFTWYRGFVLSKSWMNWLELFLHFKDHPYLDYHICVEQGLSCWIHSVLTQKASTLVCSICLTCL